MDPVPRVVFVSSHAQLGGAERFLETLLRSLPPESVGGVVSLQEGPFLDRIVDLDPVVVHTSGGRADIARAVPRLRRAITGLRPEVVHANGIKAALMTGLALAGTKIPIVWVKHDFSWDGPVAKTVAALCTRVVGVSGSVIENFGRRSLPKVRVVHGAVEPSVPPQDPERMLGEAAGRSMEGVRAIGVVGRLHPVKGHGDLIRALPAVREREPGAVCVFIGSEDPSVSSYRDELVRLARELAVGDAVWWLGHRDDVRDLMHAFDVGAIPSVALARGGREAFPLVALEYMDAGTPVVAYDEGGLPEAIGDCGVLVPPRDLDRLAQSLVDVLQDDELRDRMSRCGRDRTRRRFSVETMVQSFAATYRELVAP